MTGPVATLAIFGVAVFFWASASALIDKVCDLLFGEEWGRMVDGQDAEFWRDVPDEALR